MKKLFNSFVFILLPLLLISGCGDKKDAYKGMSADQIYTQGKKNIDKENYGQAVKDFEALESRFPYGIYSDKAQLSLIHAYYKKNEPALAIAAADRFIRMNPRHPEVDHVLYLKGLVNFDQNTTFMYRYLPLDRSARDPSSAQDSFDAFQELVERFPESKHCAEAKTRMVKLRNQLANHELNVVEYYMKRGAYLSAANRANYILHNYNDTQAVPQALSTMVAAYRHLGMKQLADEAYKTLKSRYPNSEASKRL